MPGSLMSRDYMYLVRLELRHQYGCVGSNLRRSMIYLLRI